MVHSNGMISPMRLPARIARRRLPLLATLLSLSLLAACGGGGDGPTTPDSGVPRRVTDLEAVAGTATSVTLAWTVPGADAAKAGLRYDLRYVPLGDEDADRSTWTVAPAPVALQAAGQRQQHVVAGLGAGQAYVFSLAASFDGTAWSAPSAFAVGTAATQPDATPPAGVTDLVQYRGDDASVAVAWSLAGDDSVYGRAAAYEVRYAATPLTAATWAAATAVTSTPAQHPNPAKLVATIDGLAADQDWYVGLVAVDDAGHASRLSNVVRVRTGAMHTYYVRADHGGDFPTINDAVHAALPGDVVLVAPGTYTWFAQGTADSIGNLILFRREQSDFTVRGEGGAAVTILDAQNQGRLMYVMGGFIGPPEAREPAGVTIEGFTFQNGLAIGDVGDLGEQWAGAGVALHLTDTVVRDCVFRSNRATQGGALWMGGQGGSRAEGCLFEQNYGEYGGAIMLVNSEPVMSLSRCVIRNNRATVAGGGFLASHVGLLADNLQVYGNISDSKGGGVSLSQLFPGSRLDNCTIVGNRALLGGGLRIANSMTAELHGCLVAFNLGGGAFNADTGGALSAGCGLVFGNTGGNAPPALYTDLGGNLTVDPLLCADGLHPSSLSPCLPENRAGGDGCGLIGALPAGCGN